MVRQERRVEFSNGPDSHEEHGPGPHREAPILATGQPESGNGSRGRPAKPMRIDKGGMSFPGMQPFSGMLKKRNVTVTGLALE